MNVQQKKSGGLQCRSVGDDDTAQSCMKIASAATVQRIDNLGEEEQKMCGEQKGEDKDKDKRMTG